jgi:ribonucleoside-diphosphate reductase alpha chain
MFDPAETPELNELYGAAFSEKYKEYCAKAERGELRTFKKMPATEQWRLILTALQSTSHPWITWKDPINLRALNHNTGTIHMSNLCTEICLPQDKDNVAVCNLISVNLAAHVANKEVNWARLEESVRLAVRQLDNLIDINKLPIPEATRSDRENRAIGLGVMGLADVFEKLGLSYDSEHAWDFSDRIFEFVSYMAIDESANLAQTRGSYKNFPGSRWSMGQVPVDTLKVLEQDRGRALTVSKESRHKGLNWDLLRQKVKMGMRNATLMAVAPNANIGLVAGTTPGMDPRFAQVFSRNKISGKYMDINQNLVKDLKNMGLWEKVRGEIIASQGDISNIDGIPQHIKDIYKTSFTTSPHAFIEVAARAQKWIDQAISRNMYLETRDIDETMKIYTSAWEKGVKTTYYLHMKPRHTAEQSTVRVNKAEAMGKKGFAAVASGLGEKKVAFTAPLQKSLEIVEPGPMKTPSEAPVVMKAAEPIAPAAEAQLAPAAAPAKPAVSWNIAKVAPVVTAAPVMAAPAPFAGPKQVSFAQAAAPVAAPAPAETPRGYQSLADLVSMASPALAATEKAAAAAPSFKVVNGRRVFAPSDPSEENLCDSCQ